jgi:hypothetical protein
MSGAARGGFHRRPPADRLGFADAADVIQRGADGVVANSNRDAGGLSIPLTAPAGPLGRLAAGGVGGQPDSTRRGLAVFLRR